MNNERVLLSKTISPQGMKEYDTYSHVLALFPDGDLEEKLKLISKFGLAINKMSQVKYLLETKELIIARLEEAMAKGFLGDIKKNIEVLSDSSRYTVKVEVISDIKPYYDVTPELNPEHNTNVIDSRYDDILSMPQSKTLDNANYEMYRIISDCLQNLLQMPSMPILYDHEVDIETNIVKLIVEGKNNIREILYHAICFERNLSQGDLIVIKNEIDKLLKILYNSEMQNEQSSVNEHGRAA